MYTSSHRNIKQKHSIITNLKTEKPEKRTHTCTCMNSDEKPERKRERERLLALVGGSRNFSRRGEKIYSDVKSGQ